MENRVALDKCAGYAAGDIENIILSQFSRLGLGEDFFSGKKVLLKPNLVFAVTPEGCATTHPAVTEAAARAVKKLGGIPLIAESPGGPYSAANLRRVYRVTGTEEAAARAGAELNYNFDWRGFGAAQAKTSHSFNIITPALEADIIINLPKLKSHTLAMITAAVKNLFGLVPGTDKIAVHARYKNQDDFQSAMVDLAEAVTKLKPVVSVVDAVEIMDGNGPTGGRPRKGGFIASSPNPFAADLLCAYLTGMEGGVKMLGYAAERGLCPASLAKLEILGDDPETLIIKDFRAPDTKIWSKFSLIPSFLSPRPKVNTARCIGCGKCAESCPAGVIEMKRGQRRRAYIRASKGCIRCFCCQELCPEKAVDISRFILFRLVN